MSKISPKTSGVNSILYWPVSSKFIVPTGEPIQKYRGFVLLKIPVLIELYQTYHRITDISAEKQKPGSTKNLKKMEKVSSKKLTMPSLLVVFPCCRPFPQPSSCFIQLLLFFSSSSSSSVLTNIEPAFCFSCVCGSCLIVLCEF